jgi:hypothetical protein
VIDPIRSPAVPPPAWPSGWEDAEVVAGVLVEPEAPRRALAPGPRGDAVYDRTGRIASSDRCGRLVSVLA